MSTHESAIIACTICLRPNISPCVNRDTARSHIMSNAFCTWPTVRMAWWIRPPPSRVWATTNAPASVAQHAVARDAHVGVPHVRVRAVTFLLVSETDVADDLDTGRVAGDDEHRHLLIGRIVRVGHRHDDEERRELGVRREPLLAVDDPLVTILHRAGGEHLGIGAALRFGHREARDDLVVEQRFQPLALLLGRAVVGEDLGVARVGCLTAEHDRRPRGPTQDLVEQPELHLAVALATELGPQMARPQSSLTNLFLQRSDQRVAHRIGHVVAVLDDELQRLDLGAYELGHPVEFGLELRVRLEVPCHRCLP